MNRSIKAALLVACAFMFGCNDELTDRERECIKLTGNIQCKSEAELALEAQKVQAQTELRQQEIQAEMVDDQADAMEAQAQLDNQAAQIQAQQDQMVAQQQRAIDYGPVQPGNYTNYYGNPQYGHWLPNGQFQFFDPFGHAASSTNAFLLGAGLGGLTGYLATKAAMRSNWNHANPHGWSSKSWKSNSYYYNGKTMSKNEALRRMEQSNRDRAKQQSQLKAKLKTQQAQIAALQKQKAKLPNYMTQPRAPGSVKPVPTAQLKQAKALNLTKPSKPAKPTSFFGKPTRPATMSTPAPKVSKFQAYKAKQKAKKATFSFGKNKRK